MSIAPVRRATKAGSWYTRSGSKLHAQLSEWLATARAELADGSPFSVSLPSGKARVIIAPHAGYSYSGPTAAYAYAAVDPDQFSRVFLLGPSHYMSLRGIGVSPAAECETPLGNLPVDTAVLSAIEKKSTVINFVRLSEDEQEHSLELHLPYIYRVFGHVPGIKLAHMMVGSLTQREEEEVARVLVPYLDDPTNCFVISSDFCHWGERFSYTRVDPKVTPISSSIEALDREGMALIEQQDVEAFHAYLSRTKNTICGRKPICLIMKTMELCASTFQLRFLQYAQSSACVDMSDSSVSYASAAAVSSSASASGGE